MSHDLKNEPLTSEEFEKLPAKITHNEYWKAVRQGTVHKDYSAESGSWHETLQKVYPDDCLKIIGYIGTLTGIRLDAECVELLENKGD